MSYDRLISSNVKDKTSSVHFPTHHLKKTKKSIYFLKKEMQNDKTRQLFFRSMLGFEYERIGLAGSTLND
jgi:hypothetical protein